MYHPRRNFNPWKTARYCRPPLDPDKLVKYSPKWQICRLMNFPFRGSHWRPRMRTIVISVDGGCRGNNRADPASRTAAYGVFFGPGCVHNRCGILSPNQVKSSNRAELEAVRQALLIVQARKAAGEFPGWREVIIKLDSEYVANGLSEWVWKWEDNNYMKSNGTRVKHSEMIRSLHLMMCAMEQQLRVSIRFWAVGREWNREADVLVNQALDDAE